MTAFHTRDRPADIERNEPVISYAEATRALLRSSVLDAMRELLMHRDWSKVTLSDVSTRAGISRQTLYKEFGSRLGLAQAYALDFVDRLVGHASRAAAANVGDAEGLVHDTVEAFLLDSASDPLIRSLLTGEAKPDLLRLITLDAGPIIGRAADRLGGLLQNSWVSASPGESGIIARTVVRIALSYVSMPPDADHDIAADLAALLAPYIAGCGSARTVDHLEKTALA
ncbi:TetR/AcrR family transcriptional regulator [Nocardia sp. IBHARD005]|uniref:TetR family transcriptional regulator n=1 Tax=Nocardia sp. IBHARD005 TaxID=3457765 RepID=UPI00405A1943